MKILPFGSRMSAVGRIDWNEGDSGRENTKRKSYCSDG
jgi:hypothetical protein